MSGDDALLAAIARKILADEVMTSLTRENDGSGTLSVETIVDLTTEEADAAERFIEGLIPDGVTLYGACAEGPDYESPSRPLSVRATGRGRYRRGEIPAPTARVFPAGGSDLRVWASGFPSHEEAKGAAVAALKAARTERAAAQSAARQAMTPEAQARSVAERAEWLRQTEGRGY